MYSSLFTIERNVENGVNRYIVEGHQFRSSLVGQMYIELEDFLRYFEIETSKLLVGIQPIANGSHISISFDGRMRNPSTGQIVSSEANKDNVLFAFNTNYDTIFNDIDTLINNPTQEMLDYLRQRLEQNYNNNQTNLLPHLPQFR